MTPTKKTVRPTRRKPPGIQYSVRAPGAGVRLQIRPADEGGFEVVRFASRASDAVDFERAQATARRVAHADTEAEAEKAARAIWAASREGSR